MKQNKRRRKFGAAPQSPTIENASTVDVGPRWVNPTAYVIASRDPDGKLEMVDIARFDKMGEAELTQLASMAIGTHYQILRMLFKKEKNLKVITTDEEADMNKFGASGIPKEPKRIASTRAPKAKAKKRVRRK
jgi:hypothetical protein